MYIPVYCRECKGLDLIFRDLAELYKDSKDLVIGKIDALHNETPRPYTIGDPHPTIYSAPVNNKTHPIEYERDLFQKDIAKFIEENATVKLEKSEKSEIKEEL